MTRTGGTEVRIDLELAWIAVLYADGLFDRARSRLADALPAPGVLCTEQGRTGQWWRCELLLATDRLSEAGDLAASSAQATRREGQPAAARALDGVRGRSLAHAGRLAEAAQILERHVDTGAPAGATVADAAALVTAGCVALHRADHRHVRTCTTAAARLATDAAPVVRRLASWLLALHALAVGDATTARGHVAAGWPRLPSDSADAVALVRIAAGAGDDGLAVSALADAQRRCRRNPKITSLAAAAAHADGLWHRDVVELGRAADLYRAGPRRLAHGSSLEDLGRALVDHGRRAEGVDTLSAALRTYVATGATWDAGRVRRRLRALGVRRRVSGPSPRAHGWAALTERERTVARLVADGLTNRMVAARLVVSPHTVNAHVRHAFTKLGITSRVALTRIVLTHDEGERRGD